MAFTAQQGIGNRSTGSAGVGFRAAEMGAGHTLGSGGAGRGQRLQASHRKEPCAPLESESSGRGG